MGCERAKQLRKTGADNQHMIAKYLKVRHTDLNAEDVSSEGYEGLWCKLHGAVGEFHSKVSKAGCVCSLNSAPSKTVRRASVHFTVLSKDGTSIAKGCSQTPHFDGGKVFQYTVTDGVSGMTPSTDQQPATLDPRHIGCANCINRVRAAMRLNNTPQNTEE